MPKCGIIRGSSGLVVPPDRKPKVWLRPFSRILPALTVFLLLSCGGDQRFDLREIPRELPAPPNLDQTPAGLATLIEARQQAVVQSPDPLPPLEKLAATYHANGFLREAQLCYAILIKADPGNAKWPHLYATILSQHRQTDNAIAWYQAALDLQPDSVATQLKLARLFQESGAPIAAVNYYKQALRGCPGNSFALQGLARFAMGEKKWSEAEALLVEATTRMPDLGSAWLALAEVYEKTGNTELSHAARIKGNDHGRAPPDAWLEAVEAERYPLSPL